MKKTLIDRRFTGRVLPLGALLGLLIVPLLSGGTDASAGPPFAANRFIGSSKCENCHDAEAGGNQWGAWMSDGHSKAFEVLSSDEAKKIAADLGIGNAAESDQCLKCHVTGFGRPEKEFKKSFDPKEGVGCESCHGMGDDHARARFRAANADDEEEEGFGDEMEAPSYVEIPAGEIELGMTPDGCRKCHNAESPTYKPFCYHKRLDAIRHLNPSKPRTKEQLAALLVCGCGDTCECDAECTDGCGVPPQK